MPLLKTLALTFALAIFSYIYLRKWQQRKFEKALAQQHDCKPVLHRIPYKWPFALDLLKVQLDAYRSGHSLEALTPYITTAKTIRVDLWGVTGYITTDHQNIETILSTRFPDYGMGTRTPALFPFFREGIFTQDGPSWKRSRDLIRRQFVRVQAQSPRILTDHVDDLISALRQAALRQDIVDLKPYFFDFTLGTTTKLLFGESLDLISREDQIAFRHSFDHASWCCGMRIRLAEFAPLYNTQKFKNSCKVVRDWASHFSDKALQYMEKEGEQAAFEKYPFIIDLWREMQDAALIRDQLLHVLIAGRDTTACLLSWTMFHLVRNRDILSRLQEEVSTMPNHGHLTREQIQKLTFLRSCLNETLRLYPQLPLNLRYTNKATILPRGGGPDGLSPVLLPKGTGIGWSVYHLHRSEDIYGPDSKVYRPQRWKNKRKRFWERTVDLLFSICQAGLSIVGIVAITIALITNTEPHWLDAVILGTLQLIAGSNLTWTIRGIIKDSRRAIWLVYGSIVWTAPDIAFYMWDDFVHEYTLLSRISTASVVSWALWNEALQSHKGSGDPKPERVRTLRRFVAANAIAALFQILGAVVRYSLSLANVRTSEIRHGIVLACLLAQVVALITICTERPRRQTIELIRRPARTRNRDLEGAIPLTSLTSLQATASSQGRRVM